MKEEHYDKYKRIGLKISYYRKLKGLTQENLAEKIGKTTSYLGQVEAPNIARAVSMDTLFDIADILEIHPMKLLDYGDD